MIVTAHSAFVSGLGEGSIAGSYSRDARNVARDMPFYLKYLSPAEAGRLVTEVDGGEEAGWRRGAVVRAALHLPVHSIGLHPPLLRLQPAPYRHSLSTE